MNAILTLFRPRWRVIGSWLALLLAPIQVSAGPVFLGGEDLDYHGNYNSGAGPNQKGWLYIQKAIASIYACTPGPGCPGNDGSIAVLGCPASTLPNGTSVSSGHAGAAIHFAANVALGKTVVFYDGVAGINSFFAALGAGTVKPAVIYIPGGIAVNGINTAEGNALTAHALQIKAFVNCGGGLMAHIDIASTMGWVSAVLPGLVINANCSSTGATLTPDGIAAFGLLSNNDINNNAGPCHRTFSGVLNGLKVLANDGTGKPFIIGGGCGTVIDQPCLSITNRAVDCMSTNQTYKWDFCVTNTWTDPIKYLSLTDLPGGVTVNQDIITLPSVLMPGQGTCLTIYITNTPGLTNMCFTIGAHTTNFFLCCSITNCLTFEPCCVFFSGETMTPIAGTGCYNYTFNVRNVTPSTTMRYLFLVQDPAPPPTCVTFTPDILVLPPLAPGQSVTRTVKVCIASGCTGPIHFLASAHDTNLTHCCSTRHRVPPASVIKWPGGLDGTVFEPGTILLPIELDTTFVTPSVITVYEGTNVIKNLEFAPGSEPTNGVSVIWSNVVAGTYTLRAQETDTLGGVWDADPATIYVVEHEHEPVAPDIAPPLTGLKCVGDALSFCLATTAGRTYHIESADSLTAPSWTLVRDVVGDGTIITVTNTMTSAPQRFYRVRGD